MAAKSQKSNVVQLPRQATKTVDASRCAVNVSVVRLDGKKLTRSILRQIPTVTLTEWPDWNLILGWVRDGPPWMLWSDKGRLVRSNISDWTMQKPDWTEAQPIIDHLRQLYLL